MIKYQNYKSYYDVNILVRNGALKITGEKEN